MCMRNNTLILSCVAAAVLSACTTMDTKHPDQMYRQAVMNSINKDNQYNFSGEVTFKMQDKAVALAQAEADNVADKATPAAADAVTAKTQAAKDAAMSDADAATAAAATAADAAAATVGLDDEENHHHRESFDWNEINDELLKGASEGGPIVSTFLNNSSMRVSGAVDLQQGRVEMVPSANLTAKNYGMWAKLPIQINSERESILLDVQGYAGLIQESLYGYDRSKSTIASIKRLEEGALLEIKQPDDMKERYPVKTLVRALPKGFEGYLGAMDASNFTLVPMDAYGHQLHATYRVQLKYNYADSIKWSKAMLQAYNQEFLRLQREAPEQGVSEKAYNDVKSALLMGAMLMGGDSNTMCKDGTDTMAVDTAAATSGDDSKDESESLACISQDTQKEMAKMMAGAPKLTHNLYLSRNGRILGMQDRMVLAGEKQPQALVYLSQLKMYDYGRPQFTLQPTNQNTVSIWQLKKEYEAMENAKSVENDSDAASAAAEATAAVAAAMAD